MFIAVNAWLIVQNTISDIIHYQLNQLPSSEISVQLVGLKLSKASLKTWLLDTCGIVWEEKLFPHLFIPWPSICKYQPQHTPSAGYALEMNVTSITASGFVFLAAVETFQMGD